MSNIIPIKDWKKTFQNPQEIDGYISIIRSGDLCQIAVAERGVEDDPEEFRISPSSEIKVIACEPVYRENPWNITTIELKDFLHELFFLNCHHSDWFNLSCEDIARVLFVIKSNTMQSTIKNSIISASFIKEWIDELKDAGEEGKA